MVTKEKARELIARAYVAIAEVDYDLARWRETVARPPK